MSKRLALPEGDLDWRVRHSGDSVEPGRRDNSKLAGGRTKVSLCIFWPGRLSEADLLRYRDIEIVHPTNALCLNRWK